MKSEKNETCGCAKTSCCSPQQKVQQKVYQAPDIQGENIEYISGWLETNTEVGKVPTVSAKLSAADKWGTIKVRLAINRMGYKVQPGLYAVGTPDADSNVLVTGNYKLSFDTVRKNLTGINAWLLVLDTKGINVWCAAGKGTFGTAELVNRIEVTGLSQVVKHRKLVVPQLGATGVAAHTVKKQSGFSVVYGPVRAEDIPAFLEAGMKAEPDMRQVRFSFADRMRITPVEMVLGLKYVIITCAAFFLLSGLSRSGYTFHWQVGLLTALNVFIAYLAGTLLAPMLLPWLPGRSFSLKGASVGLIAFLALFLGKLIGGHFIQVVAWLLLIPALSSFLTMNFTGASTYTSLSGVKKEMRIAVPLQITFAVIGFALWITARFI